MRRFYLGSHMPSHLRLTAVALFISFAALRRRARRRPPLALGVWGLDSAAYTELTTFGGWRYTPKEYAELVRWYAETIGGLILAGIQDYLCTDGALAATGLTVAEHQRLTLRSYLELKSLAPDVPFVPTLQGRYFDDYLRHADDYVAAGVQLDAEPTVGVGSIASRQDSPLVVALIERLAAQRLHLHAFGVKTDGLALYGDLVESADSLAWSDAARWRKLKLEGCTHAGYCNNCLTWALAWREQVLEAAEGAGVGRSAAAQDFLFT